MLELYQFEMSHYSEKVRFILDYKNLPYRKIEVTPGIGQIDLMRMSGQRQVPVLKDGNEVIADSTAIADYLDRQYPDHPLIPDDPKQKGLCLLIEQWADESIGLNARKAMIGALNRDQAFRKAFLPQSLPDPLRSLVGSVPREVLDVLGLGLGLTPDAIKSAEDALKRDLTALCFILREQPYLLGEQPTLADFAVAALTMYIKFPEGNYVNLPEALKGRGVTGIADIGTFKPFFDWRDKLYADYRLGASNGGSSSNPTSINIE
ncbi:MAG TPA: glutathione S-transferase family protein [Leptolyngbyaceae cyanobacterium M33_DOE_097]|uniref:Glutathione S-transferase family protein n=1 Tax=Oscillatoriales cyanobacterium SpSt-418 TaxID=2282169 RepID=A0A7C3KDF2_9CYAN|nr:glutathione S-transferase family protein [Leptolyngbyaceae cyanobacterium M33_DOE_097]